MKGYLLLWLRSASRLVGLSLSAGCLASHFPFFCGAPCDHEPTGPWQSLHLAKIPSTHPFNGCDISDVFLLRVSRGHNTLPRQMPVLNRVELVLYRWWSSFPGETRPIHGFSPIFLNQGTLFSPLFFIATIRATAVRALRTPLNQYPLLDGLPPSFSPSLSLYFSFAPSTPTPVTCGAWARWPR